MKHAVLGILALVGIVFAAVPASGVNVPGCGDFILFGDKDIDFENGALLLTGNVFLRNPNGEVHVGAKNKINGTIMANKIFLGTGAVVDNCIANEIVGTKGTCTTSTVGPGSFNPPGACVNAFPPPPLVAPNVPPCVDTAASIAVPAGLSQPLLPGCYGSLRLNTGSTLILTANQTYNFENVHMLRDATLRSSTPGTRAIVNVKGTFLMAPTTFLTDLLINDQSGPGIGVRIGNESILDNVTISAPFGDIHAHTGAQFRGDTELVGFTLSIEPVTNEPLPSPFVCECAPGFHFANSVSRECVPD